MYPHYQRQMKLGLRMGALPEADRLEGFELYLRLAGGPSSDPKSHPLTAEELDTLESFIVERELCPTRVGK